MKGCLAVGELITRNINLRPGCFHRTHQPLKQYSVGGSQGCPFLSGSRMPLVILVADIDASGLRRQCEKGCTFPWSDASQLDPSVLAPCTLSQLCVSCLANRTR
jgi:hypothetical protein